MIEECRIKQSGPARSMTTSTMPSPCRLAAARACHFAAQPGLYRIRSEPLAIAFDCCIERARCFLHFTPPACVAGRGDAAACSRCCRSVLIVARYIGGIKSTVILRERPSRKESSSFASISSYPRVLLHASILHATFGLTTERLPNRKIPCSRGTCADCSTFRVERELMMAQVACKT